MSNKFLKRLGSGMGAYAYAQIVTIGSQVFGLPIYLHFWTMETYGEWLMLSAIPIYFSMSDFGIVTVAGNKMTMAIANSDIEEANKVFQSAMLMTLYLTLAIFIITIPCLYVPDFVWLDKPGYRIALVLLILSALISVFGGMVDAACRANGKYAMGTFLVTTVRLMEWLGSVIAVYYFGEIVFAAAGILCGRIAMTTFNIIYTAYSVRTLKWSFRKFEWLTVESMLKPSSAFIAQLLGSAVSLQGTTLVVGAILSPSSLVIFNTSRTLSRLLLQAASIISKPLWPEFSRLYALKEKRKILKLYLIFTMVTVIILTFGYVFLYYMADLILDYWTSGKVSFIKDLFMLIVLVACIGGVAGLTNTLLAATNLHVEYFYLTLIGSCIALFFVSEFALQFGLDGIAMIQVTYETALFLTGVIFVINKIILKKITT